MCKPMPTCVVGSRCGEADCSECSKPRGFAPWTLRVRIPLFELRYANPLITCLEEAAARTNNLFSRREM